MAWRQDRIDHLTKVIQDDIYKGLYYGCVIKVARGGEVGLEALDQRAAGAAAMPGADVHVQVPGVAPQQARLQR